MESGGASAEVRTYVEKSVVGDGNAASTNGNDWVHYELEHGPADIAQAQTDLDKAAAGWVTPWLNPGHIDDLRDVWLRKKRDYENALQDARLDQITADEKAQREKQALYDAAVHKELVEAHDAFEKQRMRETPEEREDRIAVENGLPPIHKKKIVHRARVKLPLTPPGNDRLGIGIKQKASDPLADIPNK